MEKIQFNIPYVSEKSIKNIQHLIDNPIHINSGYYTQKCKEWLENEYSGYTAYMTTSCTRALELIALSINIQQGDEIILSPYNYVGVANAFSNYGAKLIFVDTQKDGFHIDTSKIVAAITPRTKAIIAMHYASIPCNMEVLQDISTKHQLLLIEDNAQGIAASNDGKKLGTYGDFSCISFDPLKNISCHEGGVLLCRNSNSDSIDTSYNNGTNRSDFLKGLRNNYEWVNRGSKFFMSEYSAAILYPLLLDSYLITQQRKDIWLKLMTKLADIDIIRPYIPYNLLHNDHNAHLAYLLLNDKNQRDTLMKFLNQHNIPCSFHYVPLHTSAFITTNYNSICECPNSINASDRILRLPIHNYLTDNQLLYIIQKIKEGIELL